MSWLLKNLMTAKSGTPFDSCSFGKAVSNATTLRKKNVVEPVEIVEQRTILHNMTNNPEDPLYETAATVLPRGFFGNAVTQTATGNPCGWISS